MNQDWSTYVESLDLTPAARLSLEEAYAVASTICPEGLVSVFLSERTENGARRALEDVWFFSDSYACQSEAFLGPNNCDLLVIKGSVTYIDTRWRDYDFITTSEDSRLYARFDTSDGSVSELRASGANCNMLRDVILRHVRSNLWSATS